MEAERRPLEEIFLEVFTRCVKYSALDYQTCQRAFSNIGMKTDLFRPARQLRHRCYAASRFTPHRARNSLWRGALRRGIKTALLRGDLLPEGIDPLARGDAANPHRTTGLDAE